jgi:hypothetical protein
MFGAICTEYKINTFAPMSKQKGKMTSIPVIIHEKLGLDAIEKALAQEYRVLKTKNSNEVAVTILLLFFLNNHN